MATMTDPTDSDHARELLRELRCPWLDAFRSSVPSRRTSELATWLSHPSTLDRQLDAACVAGELPGTSNLDQSAILAAALVAICDELDIRLPPRGMSAN